MPWTSEPRALQNQSDPGEQEGRSGRDLLAGSSATLKDLFLSMELFHSEFIQLCRRQTTSFC